MFDERWNGMWQRGVVFVIWYKEFSSFFRIILIVIGFLKLTFQYDDDSSESPLSKFFREPQLGTSWYNPGGPTPTFQVRCCHLLFVHEFTAFRDVVKPCCHMLFTWVYCIQWCRKAMLPLAVYKCVYFLHLSYLKLQRLTTSTCFLFLTLLTVIPHHTALNFPMQTRTK